MTDYCDDCGSTPAEIVKIKRKHTETKLRCLCKNCQHAYWKTYYQIEPIKRKSPHIIQVRETLVSRP
jgi:protein-arginine kinase activator protein McsA